MLAAAMGSQRFLPENTAAGEPGPLQHPQEKLRIPLRAPCALYQLVLTCIKKIEICLFSLSRFLENGCAGASSWWLFPGGQPCTGRS